MLHEFFFFLGTLEGNFFKRAIDLVIFVIVTYMIISEYIREGQRELKYLSIAFAALAFERLISTTIFAYILFGGLNLAQLEGFFPVFDNALEAFALILLANAFIYPIYKDNVNKLRSNIKKELFVLLIIFIIIEGLWLIDRAIEPGRDFRFHWGSLIFVLIRIAILIYPLYHLVPGLWTNFTYYKNIVLAFAVYLVVPVLQLVEIVFYHGYNAKLEVAQQPFPFIAVLMFTRVVYLKLVDKATLKSRLRLSEQKYKEEKELSEMKDEFVSIVSHELRTPLTSMKLYTSLLKNGKFGEITKKQERALSVIQEENSRLAALIDDILNLSRLESKEVKLNLQDIDFRELSRNSMYYSMAGQKHIKIINRVPERFIVRADPEKFKQVFVNLLDNAVKYTKSRGKITIGARNTKGGWEISISDTGRGIPKEELPKLFNKFYQIDSYMTRQHSGAGLGLAIVKKIVDLHKGDITVESEPGKGSTFTVSLPKS